MVENLGGYNECAGCMTHCADVRFVRYRRVAFLLNLENMSSESS